MAAVPGPTVALFVTCTVDTVCPEVGNAAVRLLEAAGCRVEFPAAQTCCGQPAANSGEPEAAAVLARHFVEVFEPYEAVVAPSGSCAAMVHHWYERLLDGDWRPRAARVAARTHELTGYLVDVLGRPDLGARVDATLTVHDSCHGLRMLGLLDQSRTLLRDAGATLVEMVDPEACCGFGGTFALKQSAVSTAMADTKLRDAAGTGAASLVAGDAGCLVHLAGRRRRTGVGPEPRHIAEVLAEGLP
jgi:L-lactate dehydrogenase complex protein LldE